MTSNVSKYKNTYKRVTKIGRVNIEQFKNYYRLRFTYGGKRYCLSIGIISKESLKAAKAKAQLIDSDILLNSFDPSLVKYDPERELKKQTDLQVEFQNKLTLLDIWEKYKENNKRRVEVTTQLAHWKITDRFMEKLTNKAKSLTEDGDLIIHEGLEHYSITTLERILVTLSASLNWGIEKGLINHNPLNGFKKKLPKTQTSNRSLKCFTKEEINSILEGFSKEHYTYKNYVSFLAYSGCRPEEVLALQIKDVINPDNYLIINKAYTRGILKSTKTGKSRFYKINEQLKEIIENQIKSLIEVSYQRSYENLHSCNPSDLLFPSINGKYLDHHNFNVRHWKPIIKNLVKKGLVREYLPPYHLRHTWITNLIREGLDPATVAHLAGTSTQMIVSHYLSATTDIDIPRM